jgi:hypothetical protein
MQLVIKSVLLSQLPQCLQGLIIWSWGALLRRQLIPLAWSSASSYL